VRALGGAKSLRATAGRLSVRHDNDHGTEAGSASAGFAAPGSAAAGSAAAGSAAVAAALVDAVLPLAAASTPVELSLTGGKDSRLIAATLTAAKVPFRGRTHGTADHPDVVVAGTIAARLGIEHVVAEPKPPAAADVADVLARLRSAVLVGDGMLSAFENTGRPDPVLAADSIQVGGHGGELLRGGYATYTGHAARGAVQFRRLTTRRLLLLRPAAAASYLTALAPWLASFARGPLRALDDFYLVNRAGRWSAAARQAYLLRSELVQPFFDDQVARAARTVPLRDRVSGRLHHDLLAELCPDLVDIPLAGRGPASSDWRRCYRDDIAAFLREYVLDQGAPLFDVVSERAAEQILRLPHSDHEAVWALATLACLVSGDWLSARARG
jgi:asparagine synthetase B (glutamine-hydrolysing)